MIKLYMTKHLISSAFRYIMLVGIALFLSVVFLEASYKLQKQLNTLNEAKYTAIEQHQDILASGNNTFLYNENGLSIYTDYDAINDMYANPISHISLMQTHTVMTSDESLFYDKAVPLNHIVISANLADTYQIKKGDNLYLKTFSGRIELTIYDIIENHYGVFNINVYDNKGVIIYPNQDFGIGNIDTKITLSQSDIRLYSGQRFLVKDDLFNLYIILALIALAFVVASYVIVIISYKILLYREVNDLKLLRYMSYQKNEIRLMVFSINYMWLWLVFSLMLYVMIQLLGLHNYLVSYGFTITLVFLVVTLVNFHISKGVLK